MADYFALLLILAIAFTGLLLNFYAKPYLVDIKAFMLGLMAFKPETIPAEPLFLIHFTLVLVLLAYFPFSKLLHSGGMFFSPTINQVDNCWEKRHINPWGHNYK
jgi:nitrate reductase gamma subunit